MCGIAGFFTLRHRESVANHAAQLADQIATLHHRGPDAQKSFTGPGVGLAHARLAIIDLSADANQPMASEDGRIQVVFNGEIYNFQELRKELEDKGHRFRTRSDTEVIVRGYQSWGTEVVHRLRGMFAIAIWDDVQDRLVLVRDRVGKKPLYYTVIDETLLFASEIKGILAWPNMPREPNYAALHDYLTYQYVPSPQTAFHGIHKLPPAHLMVVQRSAAPKIERYYRLPTPTAPRAKPMANEDLKQELVRQLREATRLRLIADVPLGAFLSGGVDSSAVVAMMALESTSRVKTFTIGFEEQSYDERPFARAVAERYDTDHHEFVVKPDAMRVLPSIVYHYGEPFADSSAIATYYVSQIARQHVTVALNGDGGDESFLGYPRYANFKTAAGVHDRLPASIRSALARAGRLLPRSMSRIDVVRRGRKLLAGLDGDDVSRQYEPFIAYFSDAAKEAIYGDRLAPYLATSSLDALESYFAEAPTPATGAAWADVHTYLPDDLLVKVDVASMAHSLECRSPFLDHVLMDWAATLPEDVKLRGSETKLLLKQAMEPYLPHDLLYRPKMGFGVPIDHWLRTDMRAFAYETLLSGPATRRGLFNLNEVERLLDGHCAGIGNAPRIWALLMMELWFQMWIDKSGPVHPPQSRRATVPA